LYPTASCGGGGWSASRQSEKGSEEQPASHIHRSAWKGSSQKLRPTSFSTTGVKKRVVCRDVSFGRTGAVPAPSDTAEALRLPYLRLCVLHHQGRAVVHDGVAHARRRPEMCQLRHDGHRLALARGGQALRLRRPRKLSLAPRRPVAPVRHPWAFRTDPPGPSLCPYSAECVEGVFSEVRQAPVLHRKSLPAR
jgi:hypothetical protein